MTLTWTIIHCKDNNKMYIIKKNVGFFGVLEGFFSFNMPATWITVKRSLILHQKHHYNIPLIMQKYEVFENYNKIQHKKPNNDNNSNSGNECMTYSDELGNKFDCSSAIKWRHCYAFNAVKISKRRFNRIYTGSTLDIANLKRNCPNRHVFFWSL